MKMKGADQHMAWYQHSKGEWEWSNSDQKPAKSNGAAFVWKPSSLIRSYTNWKKQQQTNDDSTK